LRRAARGYTLIELLVIATIIGIVIAAAGLAWRSDAGELLRLQAQRLAWQLELAQARVRIAGGRLAFSIEPQGYRFWVHEGAGGWQEIHDDDALRAQAIDPRITLAEMKVAGLAVRAGERIAIAPHTTPMLFIRLRTEHAQALITSGRFDGRMDVSIEARTSP
jgi:general secretion pathway protein H